MGPRIAAAALIALGVGFVVGFVWGSGTRDALGDASSSSLEGGVLTVRMNLGQALTAGLQSLLRQ